MMTILLKCTWSGDKAVGLRIVSMLFLKWALNTSKTLIFKIVLYLLPLPQKQTTNLKCKEENVVFVVLS